VDMVSKRWLVEICDVPWDYIGAIQFGIFTGLVNEFQLALEMGFSSRLVIGRDIKPAVVQHVRPLTYKDTSGVEDICTDSTDLQMGTITQVLPDGDVVVKRQPKPGEKPQRGIH
jgi:hypothetical protein